MQSPSPYLLRTFEVCGRLGSFKLAAQELGVTPSAVSHQIKSIEQQLGATLFHRGNRTVSLTEQGRAYWTSVHNAFHTLSSETTRIFSGQDQALRVLSSRSFLRGCLLPRLSGFYNRHRDIQLSFQTFERSISAKFDTYLALPWIRLGDGKWLGRHSVPVMKVQLMAMASPAYMASHPPVRRREDLRHHTLYCTTGRRHECEEWMQSLGLQSTMRPETIEIEGEGLDYQAALAGLGFVVGRRGFHEAEFAAGRLGVLFEHSLTRSAAFHLSYPPALAQDRRLVALRDWLQGLSLPSTPV